MTTTSGAGGARRNVVALALVRPLSRNDRPTLSNPRPSCDQMRELWEGPPERPSSALYSQCPVKAETTPQWTTLDVVRALQLHSSLFARQELKQLLHDEKAQRQKLVTQLQDYRAQHQCDACSKACSRCLELEDQVRQLTRALGALQSLPQHQPLSQPQHLESNQEHDDSAELEATAVESEDRHDLEDHRVDERSTPMPAPLSKLSPVEQCPQKPRSGSLQELPVHSRDLKGDTPEATNCDRESFPVSLSATSSPSVDRLAGESQLPPSSASCKLHQTQRQHHSPTATVGSSSSSSSSSSPSSSFCSFVGYEDTSLGDLFKYAVVLAGPTPPLSPTTRNTPQQSPRLHPRTIFADFRRTRSLPESQQHQESIYGVAPSARLNEAPASQPPPTPSKFRLMTAARPNRLPRQYSQTLLEFISEEQPTAAAATPPPAPMRKPGWLSNLVAQRFRGAPSPVPIPGATTAEAPARLTTTPSEFDTEAYVVSPPPSALETPAPAPPASKMLCVYPPQTKDVAELEGLVELCFPYGDRMPPASDFTVASLKRTLQERHRTYRSTDSTFVLTIASASDPCEITYAICVICPLFPDADAVGGQQPRHGDGSDEGSAAAPPPGRLDRASHPRQGCLCLLSSSPFFGLFFKVLFGVAVLWESKRRDFGERYALALREQREELPEPLALREFADHFHAVLAGLRHMRVPSMGGWSRMNLAPDLTPLAFHRPHSESVDMERRVLLLEYAAPTLFALLSVDQVLFLLGCLCCEHKVLVVSDHVNVVSSCVLALITLLSPLQWAGPVITVLPPRLDELLEAPVPLIAGRVSIATAGAPRPSTLQRPMKGVIEVNMDQNNLCMHDEDLRKYHELKLPGCDALVHELKFFSAQLFGRQHARDADFPSVQQAEASEIICSRIHRHLKFICCLALRHSSSDAEAVDGGSGGGAPATAAVTGTKPGAASDGLPPEAAKRCSDLTLDYIARFKETQMFSMFKQKREQQPQRDDDDDDEDGDNEDESFATTVDGDEDSSDDDAGDADALQAAACDTELLFAGESISYEPDALRVE
ncbi:hypothetical protein PybrP1_012137 [[Pythium] brassicae (nom. inval.)]|nr:hypothetical protein PybrP1_012137 [[Pythium] brassicae (nom. inval.)]